MILRVRSAEGGESMGFPLKDSQLLWVLLATGQQKDVAEHSLASRQQPKAFRGTTAGTWQGVTGWPPKAALK